MSSKVKTKTVSAASMSRRFVVTTEGRNVFVNGYKILTPKGKRTVSRARMRRAVEAAVKLQK